MTQNLSWTVFYSLSKKWSRLQSWDSGPKHLGQHRLKLYSAQVVQAIPCFCCAEVAQNSVAASANWINCRILLLRAKSEQGRIFGLKSGGANSKGERGDLGLAKGRRIGRKYPSLMRSLLVNSGVFESVMSSTSGVPDSGAETRPKMVLL